MLEKVVLYNIFDETYVIDFDERFFDENSQHLFKTEIFTVTSDQFKTYLMNIFISSKRNPNNTQLLNGSL